MMELLNPNILDNLESLQDDGIRQTLYEIKFVLDGLKQAGVNVVFDPFIVR